MSTKLVQYIIVNGEIAKTWPKGALIAQCCHAVACTWHLYGSDADTAEYFNDLDNMHKVVLESISNTYARFVVRKSKEPGTFHVEFREKTARFVPRLFWETRWGDRPPTTAQGMRCFKSAPDATKLLGLGEALQQGDIKHKVWIEQPENIPTCIAVKPYRKEVVQKYVKKFKLLS